MELSYLREKFIYHLEGRLLWNDVPYGRWRKGVEVGQRGRLGYRIIRQGTTAPLVHRLIWRYHNGDIPAGMVIDHINGVHTDNRIENLRCVTRTENQRNMRRPKNNTSGRIGVYRVGKRWMASITVANRSVHIGMFDLFEDAVTARAVKEKQLGFHPNHGRVLELPTAQM
jgi:hypothetical protein